MSNEEGYQGLDDELDNDEVPQPTTERSITEDLKDIVETGRASSETEDTDRLPLSLKEALISKAPHDVANKPIYEAAAKEYRELDTLRREKGMSDADLKVWADAQNPLKVASLSDQALLRVAEVQKKYSIPNPNTSGYSIPNELYLKLPLRMRERIESSSGIAQEVVLAAAMNLSGLKAVQERAGMSDADFAIWVEASYPMSLVEYTSQQKMRLAEIRS